MGHASVNASSHDTTRPGARSRLTSDNGFTLVELLVVMAIIGTLAAIAAYSFANTRGKSVESACKTDYKSVDLAMEAYKTKTGSYPTQTQLQDGSTILKSYPSGNGYEFTVSGGTITVSGTKVQGTSTTYPGIKACTKK